jgi:hypothetical protein
MRSTSPVLVLSWTLSAFMALAISVTASQAAPVLGFREDFTAAGTGGWSGGVPVFNNPGSGGVLGPADGYLYVQTTAPGNWGLRCRLCTEYSGDWNAAGITQLRLWLNDVGPAEPFEIHVSIGNDLGLWQYNVGFTPPNGQWAEFIVDLGNQADFTRILGTQSLATSLGAVDIVLIRHDKAPFLLNPNPPDAIAGDAGIDRILLTNGTVGVEPLPAHVRVSLQLAAPYPNPSRGLVTFSVQRAGDGPVTLQILDVTGRILRRHELPAGGSGAWLWDGLDEGGRRVPPGQYRVRAIGDSGGMSRPFVVTD